MRCETTAGVRAERKRSTIQWEGDGFVLKYFGCTTSVSTCLHFMDKSSRIMLWKCWMVWLLEPGMKPFDLGVQTRTWDLNKYVWDLGEYEKSFFFLFVRGYVAVRQFDFCQDSTLNIWSQRMSFYWGQCWAHSTNDQANQWKFPQLNKQERGPDFIFIFHVYFH